MLNECFDAFVCTHRENVTIAMAGVDRKAQTLDVCGFLVILFILGVASRRVTGFLSIAPVRKFCV